MPQLRSNRWCFHQDSGLRQIHLINSEGESTASLAHRYSLTMEGISTVVLGVKNRTELRECIEASDRGPLEPELVGRIDAAVR